MKTFVHVPIITKPLTRDHFIQIEEMYHMHSDLFDRPLIQSHNIVLPVRVNAQSNLFECSIPLFYAKFVMCSWPTFYYR